MSATVLASCRNAGDRSRLQLGRFPQPETSWERTIFYEMHVKGFTRLHPLVPESERGTFAGAG